MKNTKLLIAFVLISITGFSQKNLRNDFTLEADSGYYARQSKILAISSGYHRYENQKDKSMMFGLIAGMMAPTVAAFFICKNNSDKFGMTFYGAYAAIDIGAVVMFVRSELKARKIKKYYLKLENQ